MSEPPRPGPSPAPPGARRSSRPRLLVVDPGRGADEEETQQRVEPASTPVTTPQEAALYDSVVVPRWSSLFGRMLLSRVPPGARMQVLDVGCGTGHPAYDVMRKLGEGRVVAIDRDPALVDLGRRRALDDAGKRIFFKVESVEDLSFGDEVFDLVIGNLVLGQLADELAALGEMRRVLVPGGRLLLTRSLSGTFEEVLDMFRESALRRDSGEIARRVEIVAGRHPSAEQLTTHIRDAGFVDVEVSEEELRIPFRNAREVMADPMIRAVAMGEWRWICGFDEGGDALLTEIERSLDTYFGGGPLSLTVRAGLVDARSAS